METTTWVKYFTLYIVTMDKGKGDMVPCMVAHLHTVLKLFQKAPDTLAWLECDVQFRMEAAASESHKWSCGDPWQYLACFPGWRDTKDPFSVTSQDSAPLTEPLQQLADPGPARLESTQQKGKGKHPMASSLGNDGKPPLKRSKNPGVCRLFNRAPGGCPYGSECIFGHKCTNCGSMGEHGALACPLPVKIPKTNNPLAGR